MRIVYTKLDPAGITRKLVRNRDYTGESTVFGWRAIPLPAGRMWRQKPDLMSAMEDSILSEGFRNPIVVYRTSIGMLLSFGGCRLEVARRHSLPIPAIVVDCGPPDEPLDGVEVTEQNWATFFTDVPAYFRIDEHGVETHYSLEKGREGQDAAGVRWAEGRADAAAIARALG